MQKSSSVKSSNPSSVLDNNPSLQTLSLCARELASIYSSVKNLKNVLFKFTLIF